MYIQKQFSVLITITTLLNVKVCFAEGFKYNRARVCVLGHPYLDRFPGIRKACCKFAQATYAQSWSDANEPLLYYLNKLKSWQCPQLEDECTKRPYAITPYSKTVYQRFCNASAFRSHCKDSIVTFLPSKSFEISQYGNSLTEKLWVDMLQPLKGQVSAKTIFDKPCIQIAMYDILEEGRFHEVMNVQLPFCSFTWCGMTSDVKGFDTISDWTCISSRCEANIVIIIIVCSIMSLAVIFANVLVIIVFLRTRKLLNSQGIYKISIAFADLLVGLVVLPTFVVTAYLFILQPHTGHKVVAQAANYSNVTFTTYPPGDRVSRSYYDAVGTLTTTSLLVSVYTLLAAGIDRLRAVSRPLNYRKHDNKRIAAVTVAVVWVTSFVFAVFPLALHEWDFVYGILTSMLVFLQGEKAMIIYSVTLFIPIIFTVVNAVILFAILKRHSHYSRELTCGNSDSSENSRKLERRLAKTLLLMVGTFTACLLPVAILVSVGPAITSINLRSIESLDRQAMIAFTSLEFFAVMILASNSFWNCLIYNVRNEEFRVEVRKLFIFKTFIA